MRKDRLYLLDVLEAIGRIEKYAAGGREVFDTNELVQNWVVNHLTIIGEAVRALSPDLKQRYPEVPWAQIVAMRDILVHRYFAIDREAAWSAVEKDLPQFRRQVEAILAALPPQE